MYVSVFCAQSNRYYNATAVHSEDYQTLSVNLEFGSCETRLCANIIIVNDLINEPLEKFSLSLTASPEYHLSLYSTSGEVVITDDDGKGVVTATFQGVVSYSYCSKSIHILTRGEWWDISMVLFFPPTIVYLLAYFVEHSLERRVLWFESHQGKLS